MTPRPRFFVWRSLAAAALMTLAGLPAPALASAQTGLRVTEAPPPIYTFGQVLTFQIMAESGAEVSEARVFYRQPESARTVVGEAAFTPAPAVTATYSINLKTRPLPPFAALEYWWELRDTAGNRLATDAQTFYYEDNRFDWQARARGAVRVHWYEGDSAFGQTALDVADEAFARANGEIQAALPDTVDIYIYAHSQDAAAALQLTGRAWAGSHADPGLGVVIVAVAPGVDARSNFERDLAHELTHLLVYRAAGDAAAYARVPAWLDEGLAVMNQLQPDPDAAAVLSTARDADRLIRLAELCGPFPAAPDRAQLAYAESVSVVRYIRSRYGLSGLRSLLAAYADGAVCETGVERGLGVTLETLEHGWLVEAVEAAPARPAPSGLAAWGLLAVLVVASPAIFLLLIARKRMV